MIKGLGAENIPEQAPVQQHHGDGITGFYRDALVTVAFWTVAAFILRGFLANKSPRFVRRFRFFYILTVNCAIAVFLGFWAYVLFGPSHSNVPCDGLMGAAWDACADRFVNGK